MSVATSKNSGETPVETQNITTQINETENRMELADKLSISQELEVQQSAIVKGIVEQAIIKLMANIQKEMQLLKNTMIVLSTGVSELEGKI